ncbi:MAG: TetR/AcrR family transcriptional regulator [Rubrivivax sp.]
MAESRARNRQADLLVAAAGVFRRNGYGLTTMRDIAAATGMTAGSIYYHYPSKGALLLAVYEQGVRVAMAAFDEAVRRCADPWQRLERALAAHMGVMLGQGDAADFAGVFVQVQPHDFPPEHHAALIALRNAYEARFRRLMATLPLRRGTDRSLLRLHLIGSLNHMPTWYRRGGRLSPPAIGRRLVAQVRHGVQAPDPSAPPP